jgi:hypothetical protein
LVVAGSAPSCGSSSCLRYSCWWCTAPSLGAAAFLLCMSAERVLPWMYLSMLWLFSGTPSSSLLGPWQLVWQSTLQLRAAVSILLGHAALKIDCKANDIDLRLTRLSALAGTYSGAVINPARLIGRCWLPAHSCGCIHFAPSIQQPWLIPCLSFCCTWS